MINGIYSVLTIFIILSIGYFFTYKKLWPETTGSVFSTVCVKIAAPALAVISISDRFTSELLRQSLFYLCIILFYTFLLFLTGKVLSKLLGLQSGKKTIFEVTFTFSNTIFIGLPINEIVFGQAGLPYLFVFYIVTLTTFWSLGAYEISKASSIDQIQKTNPLKKIINPGLIGVLIGFLLVEFSLKIPYVLDLSLRYMGGLCVPLSILAIGANMVSFSKKSLKISKDELFILLGKFLLSPIYMYILLRFFHVDGLAFQVFMLTATMPCHMQTSILAEYYNVEKAYAAKLVSLSTLVCFITIPLYVSFILAK